ncbi:hypothetical protein [Rouxiella badensis]|uniref:hypothetical protein n=1 Tax=Rouxiella badensis TaxID=1646377 RepID=UPI00035EEBC9|nr:hypothetical protein [Rouxiella badensis]QII38652.1 hypothetical protein G3M83_13700 [Rouxiella badensis]WAT10221.1 hypothetical protein O1V65_06565 [Rouxiella badensis]
MRVLETKEAECVAGGGALDLVFNVVNDVVSLAAPSASTNVKVIEQGTYADLPLAL